MFFFDTMTIVCSNKTPGPHQRNVLKATPKAEPNSRAWSCVIFCGLSGIGDSILAPPCPSFLCDLDSDSNFEKLLPGRPVFQS